MCVFGSSSCAQASCLCLGAWDKDGTSAMREFGGHTGVWRAARGWSCFGRAQVTANKRRQGREVVVRACRAAVQWSAEESGRAGSLSSRPAPEPSAPASIAGCRSVPPPNVLGERASQGAVDGSSTTLPLPLPTARAPFRCRLIAACPTPPPTHATGLRTTASTARHRHGSLSAGPQAQPCLRVSLRREKGRGVTYRTADTCMGVIDARRGLLS